MKNLLINSPKSKGVRNSKGRIDEWCECKNPIETDFKYFDAKPPFSRHNCGCPCGCSKEHIHCKRCGGITQIG